MKRIFVMAVMLFLLLTACTNQVEEAPQIFGESSDPVVSSDMQEPEVQPLTAILTIPEGYTLPKIGMILEEKGICTTEEFIDAAQNGDYTNFSLLSEQAANQYRCYKLEGYLYPDTYEIYTNGPPENIIRRILNHTERKIDQELRSRIVQSGYTIDEVLTIASIIEKEAYGQEHMAVISSVLHNRLDAEMRLQCDVTISYVEGAIKPFITGDQNYYNDYYNTYTCGRLPAGAICNPGLNAIKAALEPAETDYFYFVTDQDKNYLFAETWEQHLTNVEKADIQ